MCVVQCQNWDGRVCPGSRPCEGCCAKFMFWIWGRLNIIWSLMAADDDVSCITVMLVKLIGWVGLSFWLLALRSQHRAGHPEACSLSPAVSSAQ